jgi:hypothetical protein
MVSSTTGSSSLLRARDVGEDPNAPLAVEHEVDVARELLLFTHELEIRDLVSGRRVGSGRTLILYRAVGAATDGKKNQRDRNETK